MKILSAIVAILFSALTVSIGSEARTREEFISAYRRAWQEKSVEKLDALTYSVGMSDADKAQATRVYKMILNDEPIESITLQPLSKGFQSVYIQRGKKIETTYAPSGVVQTIFKKAKGSASSEWPYAVIKGRYYLISTKSTDLGWKGPDDKAIGFMVIGNGQDKVQITAKWNASGVEQEKEFKSPSASFMGQQFEKVSVTSTNEATDVEIHIMESGKEIFVSGPLKGKGTIEYKREK